MIYLGNGIYSDSGPDTLSHYGVLGMKWGIHKAKQHEKNIRTYNKYNGMGPKKAKEEYERRMAEIKLYAKKNKGNKNLTSHDIEKRSKNYAASKIADYDKKYKKQRIGKTIGGAELGLGIGGLALSTGGALLSGSKNPQKWGLSPERQLELAGQSANVHNKSRHLAGIGAGILTGTYLADQKRFGENAKKKYKK